MKGEMYQSIFDFSDYREFLRWALPTGGAKRGARNELAKFLDCQKGFISQVLSGRGHFSLEHGMKISKFLTLSAAEEDYLILLMQKDKSGSVELGAYFRRKLDRLKQNRNEIKEHLQSNSKLGYSDQLIYYSDWCFAAVHSCILVKKLNTKAAISDYLGIPISKLNSTIDLLTRMGLVRLCGEKLFAEAKGMNLPSDTLMVGAHHANWRIRSIESLSNRKKTDLHCTEVMSLSEESTKVISEILMKAIRSVAPLAKVTADEELHAITLDFFSLKKQE